MKPTILITSAITAVLATSAFAQTAPPRGFDSPARHAPSGQGQVQYQYFDFQSRLVQQQLTARAMAKREPRERVDRAVRIGALIDSGRCPEAQQIATSEGDDAMATRVRQVCVAKARRAG